MKKIIALLALVLLAACGQGGELTKEEAARELHSFVNRIDPIEGTPVRGVDTEIRTEADILPDIDSHFPIVLEGTNQVNAEIFVSPEKSGHGLDGLFLEIAESFNAQQFEINGQTVSVSIRNISSGTGLDYITSGVHIPDGYTPSTVLWGQLMAAENIPFQVVAQRTIGDTRGLLMRQSIYDQLVANYGEVTISSLVSAVKNDGLLLGYTNPYTSSVGLDLLVQLMTYFDPENPVSEQAVSQLNEFQTHIPASFFTTLQLRDAAKNGSIDIMSISYQNFLSAPEFAGFKFVPMGGRQDSPMYAFGEGVSVEIVHKFTDYLLSEQNQLLATEYGFNQQDDFVGELQVHDRLLSSIQRTWRENRDGSRPTVAVFIADTSGSMRGEPMDSLQQSLLNALPYINESTYVGLVSYNSDVTIELPIAQMDATQRSYFIGTVQNLEPQGATATFDATLVALQMIQEQLEQTPNARPLIFLLSDGETNEGATLSRISPIVHALGIPIVTIGFNDDFAELVELSQINEGASINANTDDLMYQMRSLFKAGM